MVMPVLKTTTQAMEKWEIQPPPLSLQVGQLSHTNSAVAWVSLDKNISAKSMNVTSL